MDQIPSSVGQVLVKCWSSDGDVLVNGWSRAGHTDSMDKIDTIDNVDKIDNIDKFDNIDKIENIDKMHYTCTSALHLHQCITLAPVHYT